MISQITSVVCTVLSAFLDGCSSKRFSSQLSFLSSCHFHMTILLASDEQAPHVLVST